MLGRIVPWMRTNPWARSFLTGVVAASLGLMAAVLVDLADAGLTDLVTVLVAIATLVILLRTRLNSAWLIAGGVVVGVVHAVAT
jgi:chromate transporter